jgi:2-haloacid dehalogenase
MNAGHGRRARVRPRVLLLDVNETLSDMSQLATRFESVGLPAYLMTTWFSNILRDGFALAATGAYATFAALAESAAVSLLAMQDHQPEDVNAAAHYLVAGLSELPLHDDVRPALERLHQDGVRIMTLTNGSRSNAIALLERAGLAKLVEENLSVDEVGRWKPVRAAYHYAAARCGVEPAEIMMIAVHPWDVDGAKRAGLAGAWINRRQLPYPPLLQEPDITAPSLVALAHELLDARALLNTAPDHGV